jgi:hypothetical protein
MTPDDLPESITSCVYQFQKDGVAFGIKNKGRILLADEMVRSTVFILLNDERVLVKRYKPWL